MGRRWERGHSRERGPSEQRLGTAIGLGMGEFGKGSRGMEPVQRKLGGEAGGG